MISSQGQVPPYAQPQITQFAIQESIIKTVEAMVAAYGLQSLPGSDGQVQVHEDVAEMTKGYKTGTSIPFTATLNAAYDESKIRQEQSVATDTVSDVVPTVEDTVDNGVVTTEVIDAVVSDVVGTTDNEPAAEAVALTAED